MSSEADWDRYYLWKLFRADLAMRQAGKAVIGKPAIGKFSQMINAGQGHKRSQPFPQRQMPPDCQKGRHPNMPLAAVIQNVQAAQGVCLFNIMGGKRRRIGRNISPHKNLGRGNALVIADFLAA